MLNDFFVFAVELGLAVLGIKCKGRGWKICFKQLFLLRVGVAVFSWLSFCCGLLSHFRICNQTHLQNLDLQCLWDKCESTYSI